MLGARPVAGGGGKSWIGGGVEPGGCRPAAGDGWRRGKAKHHSTRGSRVIPQRSTNLAQTCLTSEIGRDRVCSCWYDRGMQVCVSNGTSRGGPPAQAAESGSPPSRPSSGLGSPDGHLDGVVRLPQLGSPVGLPAEVLGDVVGLLRWAIG